MDEPYVSPLGTKEHWSSAYIQEINQFHNNKTEVGEIWFGKDIQKKIISYIISHFKDKSISVLDIGFGNGIFLYKLAKNKYKNLYGIDYVSSSLTLAQEILQEKGNKNKEEYDIKLYQEDINNRTDQIQIQFDLIHDKGSLDAFLLNKDNSLDNYIKYVLSYSKKGETYFLITSCNNTREELMEKFSEEKGFKFIDEIKNRTFIFGGREGQRVATQLYKII